MNSYFKVIRVIHLVKPQMTGKRKQTLKTWSDNAWSLFSSLLSVITISEINLWSSDWFSRVFTLIYRSFQAGNTDFVPVVKRQFLERHLLNMCQTASVLTSRRSFEKWLLRENPLHEALLRPALSLCPWSRSSRRGFLSLSLCFGLSLIATAW